MPLHILHIQCWGFEPKDCIPTFPFISPLDVFSARLSSGGCFANAFTRLSNKSDPDPRQLAGAGTLTQRHAWLTRKNRSESRVDCPGGGKRRAGVSGAIKLKLDICKARAACFRGTAEYLPPYGSTKAYNFAIFTTVPLWHRVPKNLQLSRRASSRVSLRALAGCTLGEASTNLAGCTMCIGIKTNTISSYHPEGRAISV
jgi:hypothetical protein